MNRPGLTLAALAAAFALAGCGGSELPACGDDEVAQVLVETLEERVCLALPLTVKKLVSKLTIEDPVVTLTESLTLDLKADPPARRCQAKAALTTRLRAELLGPLPGRTLLLQGEMDAAQVTYVLRRRDDGALSVNVESKEDWCWGFDRLSPVPPEAD
jgi:hypothetical protein